MVLSRGRNLEFKVGNYSYQPLDTSVGWAMFCMAWIFSGSAGRPSDPSMWLSLKHNFLLFSFRPRSLHLSRRALNATSWDALASSVVSPDPKITMYVIMDHCNVFQTFHAFVKPPLKFFRCRFDSEGHL